jgi:hypothetical protein
MKILYYLLYLYIHILALGFPLMFLSYLLRTIIVNDFFFKVILILMVATILWLSHRISRGIVFDHRPWKDAFLASLRIRESGRIPETSKGESNK